LFSVLLLLRNEHNHLFYLLKHRSNVKNRYYLLIKKCRVILFYTLLFILFCSFFSFFSSTHFRFWMKFLCHFCLKSCWSWGRTWYFLYPVHNVYMIRSEVRRVGCDFVCR